MRDPANRAGKIGIVKAMELFRVEQDAWGQETLVGVSYDLLWLFAAAGLAFIIGHMIYMRIRAGRAGNR